jgi:hypothetical protein
LKTKASVEKPKLPRDIACPTCGAAVGSGCHSRKQPGFSAKTHAERWKAVGVDAPTADQLATDYDDGKQRNLERIESLYPKRNW